MGRRFLNVCTDVGIIDKGRLVHQASMSDIRQAGSLEERFLTTVDNGQTMHQKLSWLES